MPAGTGRTGNKLLDALPPDELDGLRAALIPVEVGTSDRFYERGRPIEDVYFPVDCVASLLSEMDDGRSVEVATVGNEGVVGLPVFLRAGSTSSNRALCQIPGSAHRMSA